MVRALRNTEQRDMIRAAENILEALLNGAVAMRRMRMERRFAAETVREFILRNKSVRRKRGPKQ